MLEILMAVAAVVAMVRIASADGQSERTWGLVTAVLVAASLLLPLPLIRVGIAFVAAFVAMFSYKVLANK